MRVQSCPSTARKAAVPALSRRKQGFESPWARQKPEWRLSSRSWPILLKHIVLVFSGSRILQGWRDVRDHVWSGLSNVGALQRTCGTIYLRTSVAACFGKISRDAQLWSFSTISAETGTSALGHSD